MHAQLIRHLKITISMFVIFTFITGVAYPAVVTIVAQVFFPWQANGSLIKHQDKIIGSLLIGQEFTAEKYFWGRPSSTTPFPYNPSNSLGSNLGPYNPELLSLYNSRKQRLENSHVDPDTNPLPLELISASASGLDPDISMRSAYYQILRIAKVRNVHTSIIETLIKQHANYSWSIFGPDRVNVLQLNLALDAISYDKELR